MFSLIVLLWGLVNIWRVFRTKTTKKGKAKSVLGGYVTGMATFRTMNWQGSDETRNMFISMCDEAKELWVEICQRDFVKALDEACDVWHATLNTISVATLGSWMRTPWPYYVIYLLAWSTSEKHGTRWNEYHCIRSKGNHNNKSDKLGKDFVQNNHYCWSTL